MIMVQEGEGVPPNTLFLVRVTEGEARFLSGVPERKRLTWYRRLRRRAGKPVEFIDPKEWRN